jgi:hypothetical protein
LPGFWQAAGSLELPLGEIVREVIGVLLFALTTAAAAAAAQQVEVQALGERVVVTGMVPIPDVGEGAPRFTSKDVKAIEEAARDVATDSRQDIQRCKPSGQPAASCNPAGGLQQVLACEAEYATEAANLAGKASSASAAAEDVRRAAAAGQADMKAVEAAELVRQEAVNKMQKARQKLIETQARLADLQVNAMGFFHKDLNALEMKRKKAGWGLGIAKPDVPEGLSLTNIKVTQYEDKKGEFARIQGEIRNGGDKPARIPGLAATLVDEKGFSLNTTSVSPAKGGTISPGKAKPFSFDMRPAPALTKTAIVTFASNATPEPRLRMNGLICPRR